MSKSTFTIVIPAEHKKDAKVKFNLNGMPFEIVPREFESGFGMTKFNQIVTDQPNVNDQFTFTVD